MYSRANGMAINMNLMQARNDRRGKRAELPDDIARKLKSCSVLNCEDWRDLSSYTTYHCFPTGDKNHNRWEIWTQLLRKARGDDAWIPFRGSLVCSHHFRPEDFVNEHLSKRRKLIKSAIPSIFPAFTVDLDDPSYQLPDDETEEDGKSEEYTYETDPMSLLDMSGDDGFEYEYSTGPDDNQGSSSVYENAEEEEIQIIQETYSTKQTSPAKLTKNRASSSGPTIVTSVGQVQVLSTSSVLLQPQKKQMSSPPQLLQINPNQLITGNSVIRNGLIFKSRSGSSLPSSIQRQQPSAMKNTPVPTASQKYMEQKNQINRQIRTASTTSLDSLPFSLNPDLEIEIVDPEEDLAACRARISELEQQNRSLTTMYENAMESLKHKYESQINRLHRRLKEQERLLGMNQISISNVIPAKKGRFL